MQATDHSQQTTTRTRELALIPLGIVLNLAIGTIIHTLKVPVYLDAVGTIVVTLLAGIRAGVFVGVLSFLIGGVLVNPVLPWFSGTQAAIAIYTGWIANKGLMRNYGRAIVAGLGLGVVAGIASAPVIALLFGGITGSGASLIVAFLLASGKNIIQSVVLSGLAAEPLDKTLQVLLALWLLKGVPKTLLERFRNERLVKNGLLA